MDSFDIRGTVSHIGDTEEFDSGFKKRLLVLDVTDGSHTNRYGVIAMKDNVSRFDSLKLGDDVTATVFLNTLAKAREYNGKFYADMPTCFKVHVNGEAQQPASEAPAIDIEEQDIPF